MEQDHKIQVLRHITTITVVLVVAQVLLVETDFQDLALVVMELHLQLQELLQLMLAAVVAVVGQVIQLFMVLAVLVVVALDLQELLL